MKVVELAPGVRAPGDAGRVIITPTGAGEFHLEGVVAGSTLAIFFAPAPLTPDGEALRTALAWAERNGAELLFVERRIA